MNAALTVRSRILPQKEAIELAWRSVWENAATCARIALTGFPYSVSLFTTGFLTMWTVRARPAGRSQRGCPVMLAAAARLAAPSCSDGLVRAASDPPS